jgi:hypothetical protein
MHIWRKYFDDFSGTALAIRLSAIPKVRTAHYPSRLRVDVRHMHVGIRVNQARAADMH